MKQQFVSKQCSLFPKLHIVAFHVTLICTFPIFWYVHYLSDNIALLLPILSQMSTVDAVPSSLRKVHFNIILLCKPGPLKWALRPGFWAKILCGSFSQAQNTGSFKKIWTI